MLEPVVEGEGTTLSVRAVSRCDVERYDSVEKTSTRETYNKAPQNDWWAAIGGAALTAAGVVAVASPSVFRPDDGKLSEKEVRGFGIGTIVVGAALLAVPVIDAFRAHQIVDRRVEVEVRHAGRLEANTHCGIPYRGAIVQLQLGRGQVQTLGTTDDSGWIRSDLDATLNPAWPATREDRADLSIGATRVAQIALAAVYDVRESRAWARTNGSTCATTLGQAECAPYADYLVRFGDGPHAAEFEALLSDVGKRRQAAADESAWTSIALEECSSPKTTDGCAPVERYLATFRNGAHAVEARAALAKGRAGFERARAQEESRQTGAPPGAVFIDYAGNGRGPTQCRDGMWSHSAGRGTCSHHGGVAY